MKKKNGSWSLWSQITLVNIEWSFDVTEEDENEDLKQYKTILYCIISTVVVIISCYESYHTTQKLTKISDSTIYLTNACSLCTFLSASHNNAVSSNFV